MAAHFPTLLRALPALAIAIIVLIVPVYGQINTACSPSMLSSFSSCMSFLTNSTVNGTSPTSDCCNSLKSITSNSTDCLCLIVTGSVPFQIPINRTLAIALPRACNMPGVPLQCKASSSPLPAPGPAVLGQGPTLSPGISPAASPRASGVPEAESPAMTPGSDATPALTPPSDAAGAPTTNSGIRPVVNPSAASPLFSFSPIFLLALLGATFLKYYY
ncbi:non-specific lipid-transfer protein-like protein [Heracleum sosnowskyi]|uniref:Non-specific lipid-transfer protein-like protein n=1 Tax=Heracleum sosnowskyi TaxID=360622 RepID=A0AAD8MZI5_9APIA|nr:non-specific lipid-transfer protein-like protein [Heracleum sosnowskyi]